MRIPDFDDKVAAVNVQTFKIFCDLVETESFTKSAIVNGVTQSAVSQQITALEKQLDTLLIERCKKRFRLTREGELVYQSAKRLTVTYDSLIHQLQEVREVISGTIRLATIYSIGLHVLPPFITTFMKQFSSVNIHVEYQRSNQVYDDVLGNVVDMGMVAYPTKDSRLEIKILQEEPMSLICHPMHSFAKSRSIPIEQISGQRFIGFESDIPTRKAIDQMLEERGIEIRMAMEFDNIETVKRAVEIDAGISIVPSTTIENEIAKKSLVAIPIHGIQIARPLALIFKRNKVLSPAMREFMAVLKTSQPIITRN